MANYKLRFFTKSREDNESNSKKYYFSELPLNEQNFRNYWNDWKSVPDSSNVELYPKDYTGNNIPQNGDIIIVYDSKDYNGRVSGPFEFTYNGTWDKDGKDGWKPSKQLEKERIPKYTSGKYSCNLFQQKVSSGLIESNTIVMLGEGADGTIAPLSNIPEYQEIINSGWKLLLYIDSNEQKDLMFYTVNQETDEISWTNNILLDPSKEDNISVNVGFIGSKDGLYENDIYICEVKTTKTKAEELTGYEDIIHAGTMTVYSHAIGEDERYRTLFENFGIPDPISYMNVFKDESIEEKNKLKYDDRIDYEQLNKKSKQLFLSYSDIFPYVGTYKALINAVDFLGYDDVYFKEWYKEISETAGIKPTLTAYNITYKNENNNSINNLPIERRIQLKKMNWLSMIYKITEEVKNENGDIEYDVLPDNVCFPRIKENYSIYDADEILIKLFGLKRWLEKNIISLNCRIIDVGGEGITFERYKYKIYGTKAEGAEIYEEKSVTPYLRKDDESGEVYTLTDDGANIKIGIKELENQDYVDSIRDVTVRAMMSSNNSILKQYKPDGYLKKNNESVLNKSENIIVDENTGSVKLKKSDDNTIDHIKVCEVVKRGPATISGAEKEFYVNELQQTMSFTYKNHVFMIGRKLLSYSIKILYYYTDPSIPEEYVEYDLSNLTKPLEDDKEYTISFLFNESKALDGSITSYDVNHFNIIERDLFDVNMGIVSMPILIQDGEIFFDPKLLFKDGNDCESIFYKNPVIQIEKGNLRKQGLSWDKNIVYSISNDGPASSPYILRDAERGSIYYKKDYITLRAYTDNKTNNSILKYTANNTIGVPLFIMRGFQDLILGKNIIKNNEDYILEIIDGKMIFTGEYMDKYNEKISRTTYLNFHYDTDNNEQSVEMNYVYEKTTDAKNLIDEYGQAKLITLNVKNIGEYSIYAFVQDEHNNIFGSKCAKSAIVESPIPKIDLYTRFARDFNDIENETFYPSRKDSTDKIIWGNENYDLSGQDILPYKIYAQNNDYCILKEQYLINNISVHKEENDGTIIRYIKYPTISYAYDTPKPGYKSHLMNISDKFALVYSIPEGDKMIKLYLKRIGDFESNTLNTIGQKNYDEISKANVVIYDNVHAEPIYQESVETNWEQLPNSEDKSYYLTFLISGQIAKDFLVYYFKGDEIGELLETKYLIDEDYEEEIGNLKNVTIGVPEEIPNEDIIGVMPFNKLFTTYIQASYEMKSEWQNDGTVTINTNVPVNIFKENQLVKLITNISDITTYQIASKVLKIKTDKKEDSDGNISYVQTYYFDNKHPMLTPVVDVEYGTNTYLAHAHQAFVDYVFDIDWTKEIIDNSQNSLMNYTEIHLKKDNNLDFVDDTFSISSRSFNANDTYKYWTDGIFTKTGDETKYPSICGNNSSNRLYPKEQPSGSDTILYKHTEPVTISVNEDIMIYGSRVEMSGSKNYNYWRLRKYNPENSENELILESWHDILMLTPSEPGIYSVELFVYDDYGNLTSILENGKFKVVEEKEESTK